MTGVLGSGDEDAGRTQRAVPMKSPGGRQPPTASERDLEEATPADILPSEPPELWEK